MKNILVLSIILFAFARAQYAVYVLTQLTPNYLNIYSGSSSGLTYVSQVATGGNGVPAAGPGIESQGALVNSGNYLFGVNPGSNTVSMFSINPANPTQVTLVGTPASSGGDYPLSVAAYGNTVCVTNSGIQSGLRCFTYNTTGLTPIAGSDRFFALNLTNPPVTHTGPAQISFTPNGEGIVVSNKGANPPLFLYTFSNGVVGATATTSTHLGMVPFGFTFDTDGTIVLTDAAPIGTTGGLELVGVTTGYLPSLTYLLGQYFLLPDNAACWVIRSPQTGHFYVSNAASAAVTEVARAGTNLQVINNYPLNNSKPIDGAIASVNGQDYFFQLSTSQQIFPLKLSIGSAVALPPISVSSLFNGGIATYVPVAATTTPAATEQTGTHTGAATELIASYVLLSVLLGIFF